MCNILISSTMRRMAPNFLASKYLHFHRPDVFFIYDSRAKEAINSLAPNLREIRNISPAKHKHYDEYLKFCSKCQWFVDYVSEKFGRKLSPRDVDKMLLGIIEENRRK